MLTPMMVFGVFYSDLVGPEDHLFNGVNRLDAHLPESLLFHQTWLELHAVEQMIFWSNQV